MSLNVTEDYHEAPRYRFDQFVLDVPDQQLWRGETRIDLNARYLDALVLLVRERGQLVHKSRFFSEVWSDVVVSDNALTQCIKEIRKQLGDDASNPRFIQTVPRRGYRFIGDAELLPPDRPGSHSPRRDKSGEASSIGTVVHSHNGARKRRMCQESLHEWVAGTLGGAIAGLFGGLLYGFGLASADAGVGTLSTLLVLVSLNVLVGLTGGFGVSFGLAGAGVAADFLPQIRVALRIAGAVFGGLFVGALAKLLGVDAFNLLFGRAPAGITGGPEGAALGAALALGAYLGNQIGERAGGVTRWHAAAGAGFGGAVVGALIPLAGGRLMGGSLDLLAKSFAESRLQLESFGPLFGELHFGQATQAVLGGIEGLLFGSCVVGALALMRRFEDGRSSHWTL
jgi:DNA-binding winged helix-turn-helix (wHTH) protein